MNRGGVGSASIVLIFAVLCLVIFSVISLISALNDETIMDTEIILVKAFYEADTLAERVLAEILLADSTPSEAYGIEIESLWDLDTSTETISFICPISDTIGLRVSADKNRNSYEILSWRTVNMTEWEADTRLNVWSGGWDEE